MTDDIGLTDRDRDLLADLGDDIDGRTIRRRFREREHARRSSRFDWAADPDRDYCQRCGAGDVDLIRVEAQAQELSVCGDCHRDLERTAAQAHIPLQVIDAD